jgi:hypothetical protein
MGKDQLRYDLNLKKTRNLKVKYLSEFPGDADIPADYCVPN